MLSSGHRRHRGSGRDQCVRVIDWAFAICQHRSRFLEQDLRGGVRMDGAEPALLVSDTGFEAQVSFFVATPSLLGDMVLGSFFCFVVSFNALALRGRTAAEAWVVFVIVDGLKSGLGRRASCSTWCGVTLLRQLSYVDVLRSLCRLTLRLHWQLWPVFQQSLLLRRASPWLRWWDSAAGATLSGSVPADSVDQIVVVQIPRF